MLMTFVNNDAKTDKLQKASPQKASLQKASLQKASPQKAPSQSHRKKDPVSDSASSLLVPTPQNHIFVAPITTKADLSSQMALQSSFYVNPSLDTPTSLSSTTFDYHNGTHKRRSKSGCVTCKIRKKKCDELRPTCGDCQRLGKACVWVGKDMSESEIQDLKRKVETFEDGNKTRKRAHSIKNPDEMPEKERASKRTKVPGSKNPGSGNEGNPEASLFSPFFATTGLPLPSLSPLLNPQTGSPFFYSGTNLHSKPDDEGIHFGITPSPSALNLQDFSKGGSTSLRKGHHHAAHMLPTSLLREFQYAPDTSNGPVQDSVAVNGLPEKAEEIEEINEPHEIPDTCYLSYPSSPMSLSWIMDYSHPEGTCFEAAGASPMSRFLQLPPSEHAGQERYVGQFDYPIYSQPSVSKTLSQSLDPVGVALYQHYRDKVAKMVCIIPQPEANFYLKTFLPMAHVDKGVLYAIIAWSAFHLGGEQYESQGRRYTEMSLKHIQQANTTGTPKASARNSQIIKLANLLILSSAEICHGDVKKWSVYLAWAYALIKNNIGGLHHLKNSGDSDQEWLAANFAYHDVMASSISERGTYFPIEDYDDLDFEGGGRTLSHTNAMQPHSMAGVNPLHGICKPLFNVIGEISTFSLEVKKVLKGSHWLPDGSTCSTRSSLQYDDSGSNSSSSSKTSPKNTGNDPRNNSAPQTGYSMYDDPNCGFQPMRPQSPSSLLNRVYGSLDDGGMPPEKPNQDNSFAKLESLFGGFPEETHEYNGHSILENDEINKQDVIRFALQRSKILEAKIDKCKPTANSLATISGANLQWQLTLFELMQATAKLHLRQSILKINSSCLETQMLLHDALKYIDVIITTPLNSSLCFPIFIAGINCVSKTDRNTMRKRFEKLYKDCKAGNIQRIKSVMEKVWSKNPNGDTIIDWFSIVKRLDWDLSFA
ncbi:hypothetical protein BABINDRAFT_162869 [Babjeviella inositovora NRRL Y-12698]|uniref:Zn(2)-C6 fungal-type domain-containing protein n=1 Tax=Babjeviella inositovora NRRL Y-12698 TaxID=984486 RepID=A0A1E3QKM1_9ASCO|nr:uncharacterized protein BABINDRAFT_162869 [Babjeviella inositovora NRRL Y-12698]ODQ78200.1 hypothetical protein BABINDRAFT_162869 [Babjeviella inositovora NRRL Y-12698]